MDGVADIQLNGQEEAYVEVKTNSYMLEAFKLTAETIASKIEGMNRNVSGGTIVNNDIQYTIKGVNLLKTIEDIETSSLLSIHRVVPPNPIPMQKHPFT